MQWLRGFIRHSHPEEALAQGIDLQDVQKVGLLVELGVSAEEVIL